MSMRFIVVLALTIAWAAVARAQAVTLTVLDPTGGTYHAHNVGTDFSITVTATWTGAGFVYWEWQDCDKQQISGRGATRLQNGVQTTIPSPDNYVGYKQLAFTADAPLYLPGRDPEEPLEFGFVTINPRGQSLNPNSRFGIIQGDPNDPYVGTWVQSMWWVGQGAEDWAARVNAAKGNGVCNFGLVVSTSLTGTPWDTQPDDTVAITQAQLNAIQANLQSIFQMAYGNGANADVAVVMLGLEDNAGPNFRQPFYFANLAAKVRAARNAANNANAPAIKFVYNIGGIDAGTPANSDFYAFLNSPAAPLFQILGLRPYAYPFWDWPDVWLPNLIRNITTWMTALGRTMPIHISALSIPVNDPYITTFQQGGYPAYGASKGHAASYMMRATVLAISLGVQRVLWYNYQNLENDRTLTYSNLGMRTFQGYPQPLYATMSLLQTYLDPATYVGRSVLPGGVQMIKFSLPNRDVVVLWTDSDASVLTPMSVIKPGMDVSLVYVSAERTGRWYPWSGQSVLVTPDPILVYMDSTPPPTATSTNAAVAATTNAAALVALSTSVAAATSTAAVTSTASVAAAASTGAATAASTAAATSNAAASTTSAAATRAAASVASTGSVSVSASASTSAVVSTSATTTQATTAATTAAVSSAASTSATSVAATTNAAAGTSANSGVTSSTSVAAASASVAAVASASASSTAATVAGTTAASTVAGAANAAVTSSVSASFTSSLSSNSATSTSASAAAAASNAAVSTSVSAATTSNAAAATSVAVQAASTAAASGGPSAATATASAVTSVSATSAAAAAASTSSLSVSGTAAATGATVDSVTLAASTAAVVAASTAATTTDKATTTGGAGSIWYVLVESAKCLDLAQLFAALATALAIPADRFVADNYNGCRQRNSLLVMHVTEDPDGTYARAVVNYLLSGAWPDVVSSSVSLTNPSAAKKGKGLHWWVFMLIALAILLVTIGVVVALCVTLHYREQSKDEGVLSKKYVKMEDEEKKKEKHISRHLYGNFISTHV